MLSLLSVNFMLFMDRVILANHSTEALGVAVTAGAICNIFTFASLSIATVSEIFIGQYHGAKMGKKIGQVLWQMIWFSLLTFFLFIPLAYFGAPLFLHLDQTTPDANIYFTWQMVLGPLTPLTATLLAFFIGTRRFRFAFIATLIASAIKILIEIPLVFGVGGIIPSMGAQGAIIATGISQMVQIGILSSVIFNKRNRARFGSFDWKFRPIAFWDYLKVGIPQCCGTLVNYTSWGMVVTLLACAGEAHLMMYTIIDSLYTLLAFTTEGLQKGVLAISANLIGARKSEQIPHMFKNAVRVLGKVLIGLAIPLFIFSAPLTASFDTGVLSQDQILLACLVVWIYFFFDGISWILGGILTAAGDTLYVTPINALSSFVFGIGPAYLMTVWFTTEPHYTCLITILYGALNASLLFIRYKNRSWGESCELIYEKKGGGKKVERLPTPQKFAA
jgi:MATE family multidrug resistance protein